MKKILILAISIFVIVNVIAQKNSKEDKKAIENLQKNISFLADDKLEGRRTGTAGEKLAYEFISNAFMQAKLLAKGTENYLQPFEVNDGKQVDVSSALLINEHDLKLNEDYFPLAFSANGKAEDLLENKNSITANITFWDLKNILLENKTNPHFDLTNAIVEKANTITTKCLLLYNSSSIKDDIKFEPKSKTPTVKIPVLYITQNAINKYLDGTAALDVKINLQLIEKKRTGHNVIGYIDNNAATTIVIGAHYDHLGYGEDHNSLYAGKTPMIHNGADDNASGTGAIIQLANMLMKNGSKKNNYLFIAFSGEELGLFGSKYFVEHSTIDLSKVNYMVNMDMVGRLNDSTHGLSIGGYGTSPSWGKLLTENDKYFKIKFDSSGTGPSDHTSFYRKDIPVLFFFTGTHSDYHKPSDDADKINYSGELQIVNYIFNLIKKTTEEPKLVFTKTREAATTAKSSFKVTLGIMPDYTFSGSGVRVDGVSDGKPAQKAGILTGDIITAINDYKFSDVQNYMTVLGKFNKGDSVKVYVKRGNEDKIFDIVF